MGRKMRIDCHLHSTISPDAKSPIAEMCRSALRKGVSVICFTEHFDMNPADSGFGYYHHDKYILEIEQAKAAYSGQIEILLGIEFSEPHQYPEAFEKMIQWNFDYVLGSVHSLKETWAGAADILQKYSAEEIFDIHYSETLKMVRFGGFDALAHMDFPRRFLEEYTEPAGLIDPILSTLIQSNIALELNSSPLNRGRDFTMPSRTILKRYTDLGGRNVTLGSDAHHADEICGGYEYLMDEIESFSLTPVVYRARKPHAESLS
jgi:histidinol-phosphatase (PHP family)